MKPADCETVSDATTGANIIFEARLVVARVAGTADTPVDRALRQFEREYWKRADQLGREPKKKSPRKRK